MKKRTWLLVGLTVIITAALVLPAFAAITRFTDVPDSNIFASDIKWMDDNAITSGCGTDLFCPSDNVTREQMSAFLHRVATKQVVDAGTLEGKTASQFAVAFHDHDADYLAATGTAADSELLEGRGASDLIRVATITIDTPLDPNDFAELVFFDIDAPTAGFLMLSASLEVVTTLNTELVYCAFELDGTFVDGSATRETVYDPTPTVWTDCGAEAVVPVTAGTHTITVLTAYGSFLNTDVSWGTASALFVPFDATGQQPTDFTPATPQPNQLPAFEGLDN